MATDRIEFMTIDTLPSATTPEDQIQLNLLRQLALHPDVFRLALFAPLPANLRFHAKHALINMWKNDHDIRSINIVDFTQELIDAIHNGTYISDLKHYEDGEILIVDDLHLIAGKHSTQEAFFVSVLKPRLENKRLTVLFSEYGYSELSPALRDDLRNLLRLAFHNPE